MKLVGKFDINYLPKTINEIGRKHWRVKYDEAKRCKALVFAQCVYSGLSNLNLKKAHLEFTRHSNREPDFDNLAGSFKHILDGLVEARVIVDDKPSIIGSPIFKWQKIPRGLGKISVQVFIDA